jgi:hypothetical protein
MHLRLNLFEVTELGLHLCLLPLILEIQHDHDDEYTDVARSPDEHLDEVAEFLVVIVFDKCLLHGNGITNYN